MNEQLKTMIQLQGYWDIILKNKESAEKLKKRIYDYHDDLKIKSGTIKEIINSIKNLRNKIKNHELDLAEKDAKYKKIIDRKEHIKSERELYAQKIEIEKLELQRNELENGLIDNFDELEALENSLTDTEKSYAGDEQIAKEEIEKLHTHIGLNEKKISDYEIKFNGIIDTILPPYRSKFLKLLQSKNGTAIGEINGEVCSCCNFQIPSYLVTEAGMSDKVVNCTNCGRFIYKSITK